MADHILSTMLAVAVPLWIGRHKNRPLQQVLVEAAIFGPTLAEKGDRLLYRSKVPGETADLFNKTASAVAAPAFLPGGITAFGSYWEAEHPEQKTLQQSGLQP